MPGAPDHGRSACKKLMSQGQLGRTILLQQMRLNRASALGYCLTFGKGKKTQALDFALAMPRKITNSLSLSPSPSRRVQLS